MTLGDNNFSKRKVALAATFILAFAACGPVVGCSGDDTEQTGTEDTGTPPAETSTDTGTPPVDTGTPPTDTGTDTGMMMDAPDTPTATPTFTPAPGTFSTPQTVTIASTTPGAKIYYTIDGTPPNVSSPEYTAPISITKTTTLKAIAKAPGYLNSEVQTGTYTIETIAGTVEAVVFAPPAGTYNNDQSVALTSTTPAATICYTLDGSVPTCTATATTATCTGASATYSASAPISVTATDRKVTAIACKAGMTNSASTSATYTLTAASAVFSHASSTYDAAISLTATLATVGGSVRYTTDGTNPDCTSIGTPFPAFGGLAISTNTTFKAITCKTGYNPSAMQTLDFRFRATAPTLTPASGERNNETTVTMTAPGTGTIICWTATASATPGCTSAATPACTGSTQYNAASPPKFDADATIRAVACSPTNVESTVSSSALDFKVAPLTFTPPTGTDYNAALPANIQVKTATINTAGDAAADNVKIHYTVDGTTPTCATAVPAAVPAPTCDATGCWVNVPKASFVAGATINAIACKTGYDSASGSSNYPDPLGLGAPQIFTATPATPVLAPPGTYFNDIILDLRPAGGDPADVTICYTSSTNLTLPDPDCAATGGTCTSGTTYNPASKPVVTQSGTRVKARACKAGTAKSGLSTADYDLAVTAVTLTPNGQNFPGYTDVPYGTAVAFGNALGNDPSTAPFNATTGVTFRYFASETPAVPNCTSGTEGTSFAITSANANWINIIACKPGYTASAVRTTLNGYRGVVGNPVFNPMPTASQITNVPTVDITSPSASAPGFKICYTTDNTAPGCNAAGICTCSGVGCVVNTAANGVDVTLPTTGQTLRAMACATGLPNSGTTVATYGFRGSQPTFTPPTSAWAAATAYTTGQLVLNGGSTWRALRNNTGVTPVAGADWALVTSQSVVVDLDATDTAGGKTLNSTLCYTTNGAAPAFIRTDAANHCTPTVATAANTVCTTGTATTPPAAMTVPAFSTTTTITATTCRFGFTDTTRGMTYQFAPNYGTVNGANNSNDFNATEELFSTTSGAKGYVTWDATYVYLGWEGAEVQNTTSNYFHAYFAGTATVTATPESGFGAETLPFADGDFHFRARVDGIDTGLRQWNGTGWANTGAATCHLGVACGNPIWVQTGGTGATSFVKVRILRSTLGLSAVDAKSKVVGAVWNGTANVSFPGGGAVMGRYIEMNMGSALPQNTAAFVKP